MTASEIIKTFTRGGNHARLTQKMRDWLVGVAKTEGLHADKGYGASCIMMPSGDVWRIKPGSRSTGSYGMALYHHIRFTDTGYTEFNSHEECERIRRDTEHEFEVLVLDANGNIVN